MTRAALTILRKDLHDRAAHARVRAGDGALLGHGVRAVPLRARPRRARRVDSRRACCGSRCCSPPCSGCAPVRGAEREQGAIDGLLLAPIDRTAVFLAKAVALFLYLRRARAGRPARLRRAAARPATCSRRCPSCSRSSCSPTSGSPASARSWPALAAGARSRELLVPLLLLPLLVPVLIAAATRHRSRCCEGAAQADDLGRWLALTRALRCGLRADRSRCFRLPAGGLEPVYGQGLRTLSLVTAVVPRHGRGAHLLLRADRGRPGLHPEDLLRARADGDRGARAASWPAASCAIQHLRTGERRGTCAPTWRSTCRSSSASAC